MKHMNNSSLGVIAPRIIRVSGREHSFERLEVEDQCDCACPDPPIQELPRPSLNPVLMRNPSLQAIDLDGAHFAMFIPSGDGIAVLNESAVALLGEFRKPRKLTTLSVQMENIWTQTLSPAIKDLVDLRFLIAPQESPVQQPTDGAQSLVAWLHLTNECNLRCHYCYLSKTAEHMDHDVGRSAVDAVFRSATNHAFKRIKLKYAGGEATLSFPLIVKLHEYASSLAEQSGRLLDGVILSNGVGLTNTMIDTMLQHRLRLMISLDGIGTAHDSQRVFANGVGSFPSVSRSIERAQREGLVPEISITVSNRNIDSLPITVGWLLDRELPFSINFYRENDFSTSFEDLRLDETRIIKGMLATFKVVESKLPQRSLLASIVDLANLANPHTRTCSVGANYIVIDHHGGIAKCQMHMNRSVTTVAASDPLALIRADDIGIQNVPVDMKEGCRDCEWRYWCAGGCPLATFRATGRYDIKSPNCNIYKALYPEVVRLEGLRLLKYADNSVSLAV